MHAHSINTQHITCITSSCETSFDSDQCFSRKQKSPPYTLTYICVLLLSNFSWPLVVISLWSEAGGSPQYTWVFLLNILAKFYPLCSYWYCHWSKHAGLQSIFPLFFAFFFGLYSPYSRERQGEVDPIMADIPLGMMILLLKFICWSAAVAVI